MTTMQAGRELDALVAEKVMGWVRGRRYGNGNGEWIIDGKTSYSRTWDSTPRFSEDIPAAWLVVERLHARLHEHSCSEGGQPSPWKDANYLTLSCLGGGHHGWAAAFTCVEEYDGLPWHENAEQFNGAVGDTPALAICRAALAAVAPHVVPSHA